ncbi:transporter substrate-binding domain-containing protein [Pseudoalteromonas aurantia]|uniref:Solute-binding protein family 3/N-terminal domain-containing protein n=2 Tax=Pseudoalteromonas TaxID=53246 RepID=A0ABY2VUK7_9GAMM|nr:transporter substrate-binding domain-containing protein [Pseudoalteromonas aurantia]TMO56304.1 hypothetical protein CWC18_19525 [Pseudoalteromonas aurantia]TMO72099.1 hypothetical protein CWC20_15875 [Pseudoalteromonas aurantia]
MSVIILWVFPINAKSINWIRLDFAPYYILEGQLQGQGRDELLIQLLHDMMPDHTFSNSTLPASRAIHELSNANKTNCMISLYKTTNRARYIQFSEQYSTIGLSPSIALRKDIIQALNLAPGQRVSLLKLLKEHKLTVGVSLNRSFGKKIDSILATLPTEQLILRPGKDPLKSLTYMLLKKRLDLIIGYPSEHYHLQTLLENGNELAQLVISETDDITRGYVGCTKNAAGLALIAEINKALAPLHDEPKYNEVMLKWLPNELKAQLNSHLR